MAEQGNLIELERREESIDSRPKVVPLEEMRFIEVNRKQQTMAIIDIEELIEQEHPARAIWELAGRLDLRKFVEARRAGRTDPGRPSWNPQLLVSMWVYAYSQGISSAREIERVSEYHPGFQWLTGRQQINHHTLSDFRSQHETALKQLFTDLLAMLDQAGLIDLEHVMHDGTKVRAHASADTFRREKTIGDRLEQAAEHIRQLEEMEATGQSRSRREAAQQRSCREREQKLKLAQEELAEMRQGKNSRRKEVRVSTTDPEARLMKESAGGFGSNYNVQLSTDSKAKIIVGVSISQSSSDAACLEQAVEVIEANMGRKPETLVVDAGYTTSSNNIVKLAESEIELIGPVIDRTAQSRAALKKAGIDPQFGPAAFVIINNGEQVPCVQCPAGKQLPYVRTSLKREQKHLQFQASGQMCEGCELRSKCWGKSNKPRTVSKVVETEAHRNFLKRMETEEAKAIYKRRGEVAEFPNAWIKDKIKFRQCRLVGKDKVHLELLWVCLAYNVAQWIRLEWRPTLMAQAA